MIKKLFLAIMIALPTMAFAQKFGIVNTATIMQELPDVKEAQTQLETASKKYDDEFKNLQTEMQKKYEELQKSQENKDPQGIIDRRMSELQSLDQKIQEFRQTAAQDLQRQQEQLLAPIQQKVINAINAVGAEGNYTFIFENTSPVYVGTTVTDITTAVKGKLGLK
ncbi:MAG: OmpH family outer membrane protein [Firmicutes bacterium]|nr:OmpH family outer membrane protein [Bacillota bacterium]MCM1401628.1 OmpH family outer membrane protein [Bacteroides sp.]MCM1477792.1 OmpH family outer membrane protein [Bacteroides sp.]